MEFERTKDVGNTLRSFFSLYLKTLQQQVYDAHQQLMEVEEFITVQSLKEKLF